MSDRRGRRRSAQEESAFALPADRLPWFVRASNLLGRTLVRSSTRVSVAGLEHVPPSGPLILASNHLSNGDPALVACWLTPALGRPVHWMAKAEALDWPIGGWFMRHNGAFGIRRGAADTEAFRLAKSVLDDGRVLGTFPEGTRSPTGALQVAPNGVTLLALRTGAPILPIGVAGTDRFWPRGRKVWRVGGANLHARRRAVRPPARDQPERPPGDARGDDHAPHAAHRRAPAGASPRRLRAAPRRRPIRRRGPPERGVTRCRTRADARPPARVLSGGVT